jgi:hypothetical protein
MDTKLNDTWTLYFHAKNLHKKYNDNTSKIIEIDNIKTFWGALNNLPKPTEMFSEPGKYNKIVKRTGETPAALSLFRKNSYPTWEDLTNQNGFEWSLKKYKDFNLINDLWINILVKTIGENFEHSNILNGVRIVDCSIDFKIIYRLEFWFSDKNFKDYFESKVKEFLELSNNIKLLYRDHSTLKESRN